MTGIPLGGRPVDLEQLKAELAAAGVPVTGIGVASGALITYNAQGEPADLPPAATAVVTAHTPSTAVRDQLVSALTALVGVQIGALTQAQVGLLMRAVLFKFGAVDRQSQIKPLNLWLV